MDFAIFSTRIFTGNPAQAWAEALKITDHRITHVGSNTEVKKASGTSTGMLDLPGRLVTPGLVDAHCHFLNLGRSFQMVNLRNAASLAEVRELIQQAVGSRGPTEWIIGRGWNHHQWEEQREPTRKYLDDIIPMPLPGGNAPVTLAGTLVEHTAENLSGTVMAQLINPGTPVLYGGGPEARADQKGYRPSK